MSAQKGIRRPYGTGALIEINGAYYGKWRINGRQVKRKIGPVRKAGTREGLTKTMAEARLREMIAEIEGPPVAERVTVEEAGRHLVAHLTAMGRKRSTLEGYDSYITQHIAPYFSGPRRALADLTPESVEGFMAACRRNGQSAKSTANYLGLLHGIYELGLKRKWVTGANPCKLVDKPRAENSDPDIHFLDENEVDLLIAAVSEDPLGRVEAVMYLAAVQTGMRQGELLALRWLDVDWAARRIRVRQNFVRGEFGTPKSKRSSRSVPLSDELGGALDRHFARSPFQADDDLVFAHPLTGKPIDRSRLLKRYKATLRRAGVREVRFHDLRHTFGTRMAGAGIPMRTIQEWMGHRDFATTLIYADYAPSEGEVDLVNRAFARREIGTRLVPETETLTVSENEKTPQVRGFLEG